MSGSRMLAIPVACAVVYAGDEIALRVLMKFCKNVMLVLVTVEACLSGGVTLNRSLSVPWLNTVLIAGRPIWSLLTRWSGSLFFRVSVFAHFAILELFHLALLLV